MRSSCVQVIGGGLCSRRLRLRLHGRKHVLKAQVLQQRPGTDTTSRQAELVGRITAHWLNLHQSIVVPVYDQSTPPGSQLQSWLAQHTTEAHHVGA